VRAEDARGDARDLGRGLRDARHRGVV
jgi:hypothetical protein